MNVTIVGFGHVGRSLWEIEKNYHSVTVCDKNEDAIRDIPNSTMDIQKGLKNAEVAQICFPVPFKNTKPHVKDFLTTIRKIEKSIPDKALIIIESTIPVATTERAAEILKKQYVVHSPVRGTAPYMVEDIKKLPKIVGGINEESTKKAVQFYESVKLKPIPVANPRIAELFKLVNNVWQDVNIAYANEWARIAAFYNVDPDNILQLMKTSVRRTVRTYGYVGGHCVPTNPYLLCADLGSPLIALARKINEEVIERTITKVKKLIESNEDAKVAIVGLSYKPRTASLANSPAIKIIEGLKGKATILVYDPLVDDKTLNKYGRPVESKQLASADIIINCHSLPTPSPKGPKIIDAKNVSQNQC